jgi:hypothetical protein
MVTATRAAWRAPVPERARGAEAESRAGRGMGVATGLEAATGSAAVAVGMAAGSLGAGATSAGAGSARAGTGSAALELGMAAGSGGTTDKAVRAAPT